MTATGTGFALLRLPLPLALAGSPSPQPGGAARVQTSRSGKVRRLITPATGLQLRSRSRLTRAQYRCAARGGATNAKRAMQPFTEPERARPPLLARGDAPRRSPRRSSRPRSCKAAPSTRTKEVANYRSILDANVRRSDLRARRPPAARDRAAAGERTQRADRHRRRELPPGPDRQGPRRRQLSADRQPDPQLLVRRRRRRPPQRPERRGHRRPLRPRRRRRLRRRPQQLDRRRQPRRAAQPPHEPVQRVPRRRQRPPGGLGDRAAAGADARHAGDRAARRRADVLPGAALRAVGARAGELGDRAGRARPRHAHAQPRRRRPAARRRADRGAGVGHARVAHHRAGRRAQRADGAVVPRRAGRQRQPRWSTTLALPPELPTLDESLADAGRVAAGPRRRPRGRGGGGQEVRIAFGQYYPSVQLQLQRTTSSGRATPRTACTTA